MSLAKLQEMKDSGALDASFVSNDSGTNSAYNDEVVEMEKSFHEEEDANDKELDHVVDLETAAIYDEDVRRQGDILNEMFEKTRVAAQTQLVEVKRVLLNEKKKELEVRDIFYTDQMRKQQGIINQLSEKVVIAEAFNDRNLFRLDSMSDKLTQKIYNTNLTFASKYSVFRFFSVCRDNMYTARRNKQIIKLSDQTRRKRLMSNCFMKISREAVDHKQEKKQAQVDIRHDNLVKDIIKKYEYKLNLLRSELGEAHATARQEQLRRQQLEEDLRSTFLKNMTNLNMEAMNIFQHSYEVEKAVTGEPLPELQEGPVPKPRTRPPQPSRK